MSNLDIIRAWKDEDYRNSLSAEQLALLPENPAGMIEISDDELDAITGGAGATGKWFSTGCPCSRQQGGTCPAGTRGCCHSSPGVEIG